MGEGVWGSENIGHTPGAWVSGWVGMSASDMEQKQRGVMDGSMQMDGSPCPRAQSVCAP